ncbi:MAG: MGMT family protein [Verrucomicrobia bacterium]|nr:MGMT family protein [Verrucomicrobiota bacterium]
MANAPSHLALRTSWGTIRVRAAGGKVTSCSLPKLGREPRKGLRVLKAEYDVSASADRKTLQKAERFIRDLFAGQAREVPPLVLPDAGAFTTEAWKALARIPFGSTLSYGELAKRAGSPGAARAAGSACGLNDLPLFVPCHRVLGAQGRLGGFSAGLAWKRELLRCEGLQP